MSEQQLIVVSDCTANLRIIRCQCNVLYILTDFCDQNYRNQFIATIIYNIFWPSIAMIFPKSKEKGIFSNRRNWIDLRLNFDHWQQQQRYPLNTTAVGFGLLTEYHIIIFKYKNKFIFKVISTLITYCRLYILYV